jgi:hypothetical protein
MCDLENLVDEEAIARDWAAAPSEKKNTILSGLQARTLLVMKFSLNCCYFLIGLHILLNTVFSNTLYLLSSLNVRNQVAHPLNTRGR